MTTATEIRGTTITEDTYFIFYGEHDSGSDSKGFMVREGFESAERSERLLGECGYQRVEVKWGMDLVRG